MNADDLGVLEWDFDFEFEGQNVGALALSELGGNKILGPCCVCKRSKEQVHAKGKDTLATQNYEVIEVFLDNEAIPLNGKLGKAIQAHILKTLHHGKSICTGCSDAAMDENFPSSEN